MNPKGQRVHVDMPLESANVPALQNEHEVEPLRGEYEPRSHNEQLLDPVGENEPGLHGVQVEAPIVGDGGGGGDSDGAENLPASQKSHEVEANLAT